MADPNKIANRDNKILAKESGYRRGRIACLIIAALTFLFFLLVLIFNPNQADLLAGSSAQTCFWLALACNCHIRLQHIQTIKLGRFCPSCNYDLRGNPDATNCPECGVITKPSTDKSLEG